MRPFPHPLSHRSAAPIVVAAVGMALTLGAFFLGRTWVDGHLTAEFYPLAHVRAHAIENEVGSNLNALHSIASFYAASREVTRERFGPFAASVLQRHPTIQAVEWIPRVPRSERAVYEEAQRREGLTAFRITERTPTGELAVAGDRPEYWPVSFMRPMVANLSTLGFDLGSEPERFRALETARDSGALTATGRVTLVEEAEDRYGIVVFLPVYHQGMMPETVP